MFYCSKRDNQDADCASSFSPELQEVIINAANEARDYKRELNAKESDDAVERLKSKDMAGMDFRPD